MHIYKDTSKCREQNGLIGEEETNDCMMKINDLWK